MDCLDEKVRNCSPATCNVRLSALRAFLKYLSDNDISFVSVFLQAENVPNEKLQKESDRAQQVGC